MFIPPHITFAQSRKLPLPSVPSSQPLVVTIYAHLISIFHMLAQILRAEAQMIGSHVRVGGRQGAGWSLRR